MSGHFDLDNAKIQRAVERLKAGESAEEVIHFGGEPPIRMTASVHPDNDRALLFVQASEDDVEVVQTVLFHASKAPPPVFPVRFPFVSGCLAFWSETAESGAHIAWIGASDGGELYSKIRAELISAGWTQVLICPPFEDSLLQACFEKDGLFRVLALESEEAPSLVSIIETLDER